MAAYRYPFALYWVLKKLNLNPELNKNETELSMDERHHIFLFKKENLLVLEAQIIPVPKILQRWTPIS